jgi:hypothetical protein
MGTLKKADATGGMTIRAPSLTRTEANYLPHVLKIKRSLCGLDGLSIDQRGKRTLEVAACCNAPPDMWHNSILSGPHTKGEIFTSGIRCQHMIRKIRTTQHMQPTQFKQSS